jgi:hypothetical protein
MPMWTFLLSRGLSLGFVVLASSLCPAHAAPSDPAATQVEHLDAALLESMQMKSSATRLRPSHDSPSRAMPTTSALSAERSSKWTRTS